jgi:hypothetical protein
MIKWFRVRWVMWRLRKPLRERARLIEKKLGYPKGTIELSIDPKKL